MHPTTKANNIATELARLEIDINSLGDTVRRTGLPADQLLDIAQKPGVPEAIGQAIAKMEDDGTVIAERSRRLTDQTLQRLKETADDPDASPALLLRIGEFAFKASGLAEERAAKLRVVPPEKPIPLLVVLGADEVEPPAREGEPRIVIRFGASAVGDRHRTIDVTPTGGDDA